ncbi:hypothetical protein niasHT_006438 [Heterodera trifolii]|uniref:Uncharacterized protein n=1 Tax=Heterodera trifolii TaxID=157864 RepID=A0ABD2LSK4_9BILA
MHHYLRQTTANGSDRLQAAGGHLQGTHVRANGRTFLSHHERVSSVGQQTHQSKVIRHRYHPITTQAAYQLQCAAQSRTSKGITDLLLLIIFDSKPVNAPPNIHQEVVLTKAGSTLYMHHNRAKQSVKPYAKLLVYCFRRLPYAGESETTIKVAPQQQPPPFSQRTNVLASTCPRRLRPTEQNIGGLVQPKKDNNFSFIHLLLRKSVQIPSFFSTGRQDRRGIVPIGGRTASKCGHGMRTVRTVGTRLAQSELFQQLNGTCRWKGKGKAH